MSQAAAVSSTGQQSGAPWAERYGFEHRLRPATHTDTRRRLWRKLLFSHERFRSVSRSTGEGTRKHSAPGRRVEGTAHASFHSSSTRSKFSPLILKLQMMNSPTPCRGSERASKKALCTKSTEESAKKQPEWGALHVPCPRKIRALVGSRGHAWKSGRLGRQRLGCCWPRVKRRERAAIRQGFSSVSPALLVPTGLSIDEESGSEK